MTPDVPEDDGTGASEATLSRGLRAVLAAADELLACPDLDTLVRRTVEIPRERLGIERCSLFVRDGGFFSGTYGTDMEGHTTDEREYKEPAADYMPANVLVPPPEGPRWVHIPSTMKKWEDGEYRIGGVGGLRRLARHRARGGHGTTELSAALP